MLQGERATLTINGISGNALTGWLGEVRSAARARPVEATLSRGQNGYSGSIALQLARAGRTAQPRWAPDGRAERAQDHGVRTPRKRPQPARASCSTMVPL